ncbi:type IV toxin-antitoxin system AbiEi family antitoxin domain-containing protein [Candidatus Peregrinibacteria bacterium]|nr:type IV toxin-antitoxin system AbiEi family antitoxin domain-containing protein [Candidatus Peregrinibacteria bacterium]
MKYTTILSAKQGELLENLIVKYGNIVTIDNILTESEGWWDYKQSKNLITKLVKQGWLIRIKRGLYVISDLSTRGFLSLSSYVVANLLVKDSYVSFESALRHHGMFDQLTSKIISVSLKMYKTVQLQNIEYSFVKTKADYYFGWQEATIDNKTSRIATAEKALIDMVNFHKSIYAIDLVIEKLREHKNDLDFARLNEYVGMMSMTTIKIFGVIFDLLKIDSSQLLKFAKQSKGAHRMIANTRAFNAKWRLYYDTYFDKYRL